EGTGVGAGFEVDRDALLQFTDPHTVERALAAEQPDAHGREDPGDDEASRLHTRSQRLLRILVEDTALLYADLHPLDAEYARAQHANRRAGRRRRGPRLHREPPGPDQGAQRVPGPAPVGGRAYPRRAGPDQGRRPRLVRPASGGPLPRSEGGMGTDAGGNLVTAGFDLTSWRDTVLHGGLPAPARAERWQPLRAGVVNLWEYDAGGGWYADGG